MCLSIATSGSCLVCHLNFLKMKFLCTMFSKIIVLQSAESLICVQKGTDMFILLIGRTCPELH